MQHQERLLLGLMGLMAVVDDLTSEGGQGGIQATPPSLAFIDQQSKALGPSRSILLLYQEKRKHETMLKMYANHLRSTPIGQQAEWEKVFEGQEFPTFFADLNLGDSHSLFHGLIRLLLMTQLAIHFADALVGNARGVQPVWAQMHRMYAKELYQHRQTLVAHLRVLEMSPSDWKNEGLKAMGWAQNAIEYLRPLRLTSVLIAELFPDRFPTAINSASFGARSRTSPDDRSS